jgi:hypothetical protein
MRVLAFGLLLAIFSTTAHADDAWVQVKESKVRSKPLFYAPGVSSVRYGDKVATTGDQGGWVAVRVGGVQGYLPLSALSRQQIVLTAKGLSKVEADSTDVVLAGKGFSKEVEQSFKAENTGLRYDLVDRVEQTARVPAQEVAQFVKKGGLNE